ncbi:membrane-anchored protein [Thioploca ingrica]|uniref:Membrane-anchored protein n=1 Tax=Thioploca ingrica TaxID=40754 RepID=A0A090AGW2_9GAMM|nr:membrane-anchored protein [Thioploca ingrica]
MTMNIGYEVSSIILIGLFLATLVAQLISKKYHPLLYWSVILSTSTAGTTMSDYMDRTLGLGYAEGSMILMTCLLAIFAIWRLSESSLSVTDIKTSKVELLYWITILFSNTLGTALGDFLADDSGLGFSGGAALIGGLLGLLVMVNFYTKVSKVFLFWVAFVLTRPFGATLGDVLTKSPEKGGLNFGTVGSSLILVSILVIFIIYTTVNESRKAQLSMVGNGSTTNRLEYSE